MATDHPDPFEEAKARSNRLFAQFERAQPCEVVGVVAPGGPGMSQSQGEDFWTLVIGLDRWRVRGQQVRAESLTLRQRGSEGALDRLRKTTKPYSVLRMRAGIVETNEFGSPQGELLEIIGPDDDAELHARAAELRAPAVHHDPQFGALTLDRSVDWYSGETRWNEETIEVNFEATSPEELKSGIDVARALWTEQASWNDRVRAFAVERLLDLKNGNWVDEEEGPISSETFLSRMKLRSITIRPNGAFEFWHDDGDLFFGHSIMVSGSLADGLQDVDIPG
jgi:hypothetical protein